MGVQKGDKRGRYATKRAVASKQYVDELAATKYAELVCKLYNDMTVKSESSRMMLAEAAASLRMEYQSLRQRIACGEATVEELKMLPAVCSNLRRILESGGLLADKYDPDDDEDLI